MNHIVVKLLALIALACSLATTARAESSAKQDIDATFEVLRGNTIAVVATFLIRHEPRRRGVSDLCGCDQAAFPARLVQERVKGPKMTAVR